MNNENLEITALIGSFDGSELEGIEPLKEGEDFFFPAHVWAGHRMRETARLSQSAGCDPPPLQAGDENGRRDRRNGKAEGRQRRRAGVSTAQFLRRNTSARRTSTGCCSISSSSDIGLPQKNRFSILRSAASGRFHIRLQSP